METALVIIVCILLLPFAAWLRSELYTNGYNSDDYLGYGFLVRWIKKLFKK